MKTFDLKPPYFTYKSSDILIITVWIDGGFFIQSEVKALDLEKALLALQENGINVFPDNSSSSRFIHYLPHRIDKIEVAVKVEDENKSQNK